METRPNFQKYLKNPNKVFAAKPLVKTAKFPTLVQFCTAAGDRLK